MTWNKVVFLGITFYEFGDYTVHRSKFNGGKYEITHKDEKPCHYASTLQQAKKWVEKQI